MVDNQCAHHWLIETSQGSMSEGVCRLCGEKREFHNSLEAFSWVTQAKKARQAKAASLLP